MIIHATNTSGLGASHVTTSFIDAASNLGLLNDSILYLPKTGPLKNYLSSSGNIVRHNRWLPNGISRLIECLFASYIFPSNEQTIVLGDIPLRGIVNQIVLVHQPNLVSPKINKLSSNSWHYKILRILFKINLKFAKYIVVQTDVMKADLIKSYPELKEKVIVMPQPLPNWFILENNYSKRKTHNEKKILFYPAAGYSHKNHQFLIKLNDFLNKNKNKNKIENLNFKILLTLTEEEFIPYNNISFVKNLGRLDSKEIISEYNKSDGLLFLSLMESYGLPLVEALNFQLPVIVVDLPYSRWMCGKEAYYFENDSIVSFLNAINKFNSDMDKNLKKDYTDVLKKFPSSWDSVVKQFINLIQK